MHGLSGHPIDTWTLARSKPAVPHTSLTTPESDNAVGAPPEQKQQFTWKCKGKGKSKGKGSNRHTLGRGIFESAESRKGKNKAKDKAKEFSESGGLVMDQDIAGSAGSSGSQSPDQSKVQAMFWPKELLPEVIPETRIHIWGCDVDRHHILSTPLQSTVSQHAAFLLSDIASERTSDEDVGPNALVRLPKVGLYLLLIIFWHLEVSPYHLRGT